MVGQAPRPRHYEFERARPDGLGGWEASRHGRASASKLPVPPGLSGSTVKLSVLEDEFRMATVGRVASCALVGWKIRCRPAPPIAPACDIDRLEFPSGRVRRI
jgi:hypothetical protein